MVVHVTRRNAVAATVAVLATVPVFSLGAAHAESGTQDAGPTAGQSLTGIQIQNVDSIASTDVQLELYGPNNHDLNSERTLGPIGPGQAANLWLPGAGVAPGAYTGRASSDHEIAGLVRTDWPASGGAAMYSSPVAGREVILPLIIRNYFGQSSVVAIQNLDSTNDAFVTIDIVETGATSPSVHQSYTARSGTSLVFDLRQSDPYWELWDSFIGTLFVSSDTDVAVASFVEIQTSYRAVYAFEGVPIETSAPTLYVPLFRASQYPRPGDPRSGRLDTGMSVVNVGDGPTSVGVTYYGAGGSCAGQYISGPDIMIPAHSSHVFYQGDTAGQGLTPDCYGSAVIRSSQENIVAVVNDAQNLNQTSAAFLALPAEQASTRVSLPLFRKAHFGLTSGVSVMNVGPEAARITMKVTTNAGQAVPCPTGCTATVDPNETAIYWPGALTSVPNGMFGSAVVESTQPVMVIVNDVSVSGAVDMATYNGIAIHTPAAGPTTLGLPLLLNVAAQP